MNVKCVSDRSTFNIMTIMRTDGSGVIPESWGCVFERGPVAKPGPGVDSAGGEPESLGLPDSSPDKTDFSTLVLSPHGAFWRTQSALGVVTDIPVSCDLSDALIHSLPPFRCAAP